MSKPNTDELRYNLRIKLYDWTDSDDVVKELEQLLLPFIQTEIDRARLDEARYFDEHIIGSPRKVTVNERVKDRIQHLKDRGSDE